MPFFTFLITILLASHFYRHAQLGAALLILAFNIFSFYKISERYRILQIFTIFALCIWGETFLALIRCRLTSGDPFVRLALIGVMVIVVHLYYFYSLQKRAQKISNGEVSARESQILSIIVPLAFYVTFVTLFFLSQKRGTTLLLGMRWHHEIGQLQIFAHALYSALLVRLFVTRTQTASLRSLIWNIFLFLFFAQFFLGLLGFDSFLMSGKLHYPIPALILSAPIFYERITFMILLLLSTIILVGPAWCSHLCYFGALDNILSKLRKAFGNVKIKRGSRRGRSFLRLSIFALAVITPLILGQTVVHYAMALFILLNISILWISYHYGIMNYCRNFCPIALITTTLGSLHPFKVRIKEGCDQCMKCAKSCSYGAITQNSLSKGRMTYRCTLCLDCLYTCPKELIGLNLGATKYSREIFYLLIITMHSIFLAVARI